MVTKEFNILANLLNKMGVGLDSNIGITTALKNKKNKQNELIKWSKENKKASEEDIMVYVFNYMI